MSSTGFSLLNREYPLSSDSSSDAMLLRSNTFDGELPMIENPKFCEKQCCKICSCWFGIVVLGLIIGAVIFLLFPPLGVFFVALTPAVAILSIARDLYGDQVTIGQMIVSFFETILWMIPLLLWDMIWFAIDAALDKEGGVCALCLLAYFLQAYFFAGFCEEFVKYLVIARLTSSKLTKDWRTMLVYGICSGAGFGSLENILYVAQYGLATGIVRGLVSVPLHCTTGAIIGLNLANKRPIELPPDADNIQSAIAYTKIIPQMLCFPWLIHGTFDFCLMVSSGAATRFSFIGFLVALIVFLAGIFYARHLTLFTLANNPAMRINIHDKIISGEPPIVGESRISSCCGGNTNWVCHCFFICSCCCRSDANDLEAIRANNNYRGNTVSNTPPVTLQSNTQRPPHQNEQSLSNVVYVHTV